MSGKNLKKVGDSIEESRRFHKHYLRALSSPVRRKILRALKKGGASVEELQPQVDLDTSTLKWHLKVLEQACCVEAEEKGGKVVYMLTQAGQVVDYVE